MHSDTALVLYSPGVHPVIEFIQKTNTDDYSMTNGGRRKLIHAAWQGQKEVVNHFLQNNITSNDDGETALFVAASFGNKDIVEILLQNNIDINSRLINSKTYTGETALIFASRNGQTQIVEVLLQHNAG